MSLSTSVVIPAYNGLAHLEKNLQSVVDLKTDEIVIVDDASIDDSVSYISTHFPKIKLVRHTQNIGFTRSVNDGFNEASGEIVFLLNQDVMPSVDLVKKTLPHFKDSNLFAVTFNEGDRSYAQVKWEHGILQHTNGPRDGSIHISAWASGGSAAFRHTLWNKLGGFDPIFSPGYSEDLDLGLSATKAGYKIIWDPACKVVHATETSFPKKYPPKKLQRIKERNYLLTQWKHIDPKLLPEHVWSVLRRSFRHPGYLLPVMWALWKKLV